MRNKYNAKKFKTDGYTFDSKAEGSYYVELKTLLRTKSISDLELQPQFILSEGFKVGSTATKSGISKISQMKYTPDFRYKKDGEVIVVEVKGIRTEAYNIRKKIFLSKMSEFGVDVFVEVIKSKEVQYKPI